MWSTHGIFPALIAIFLAVSRPINGIETSGASSQSTSKTQQHHEPMVAMICPGKQGTDTRLFHNQYINPSDGKWTTDLDHKATCRQDKVEILEYCKKVYPDQDINNIVESNHYVKVSNWCKLGRTKCKGPSRWVKPFRCLGNIYFTKQWKYVRLLLKGL